MEDLLQESRESTSISALSNSLEESSKPASETTYNWESLRGESLLPGGFGSKRVQIWPWLLNVSSVETEVDNDDDPTGLEMSKGHQDERQIQLDTDRSFVLYPGGVTEEKDKLQAQLHYLLVSIFRKHPKLRYFQGYHDIISVLYLTLPKELQLPCAEKISLHRLRDSMGNGLEPVLGLLRILKNLLELAEPEYASLIEETAPLPYFALSNLLTLFSHDMPTLDLVQHVFDFLLCRPPIATVYLTAALILSRKAEVIRLQEEGEDGMLHSLLSGLPDISDEVEHPTEDQEPNSTPSDSETAVDEQSDSETPPKDPENDTSPIAVDDDSTSLEAPPPMADEKEVLRVPPLRPKITLSELLIHADELFSMYPPTHPHLHVSTIMGPQSVLHTWSEKPGKLPSDSTAEAMVLHPELVVYPFIETNATKEKPSNDSPERGGKALGNRKKRLAMFGVDRKLAIAGAVLVLAVAIGYYGARMKHPPRNFAWFIDLHCRSRDWRRMGGWVGIC